MNPMTHQSNDRLLAKCMEIYGRKRSLEHLHQLLERLEARKGFPANLSTAFWEDVWIPAVKTRYFKDESIDSLLEKSMELYRSNSDKTLALELIWEGIEWKYPFDGETYGDFVERLDDLLANKADSPTKADWEHLDECLMK
jgi:hypothetical protein